MRRLALLSVPCLVLAALHVTAHAEDVRTVPVNTSIHGTSPVNSTSTVCAERGGAYDPGLFPTVYSGTSKVTGTMSGTADFCGWIPATANADGSFDYFEADKFTGTIQGCGNRPGSVIYDVQGRVYPTYNSDHRALNATETWEIANNSGRGGLAGVISGGGRQAAWLDLVPTTVDSTVPNTGQHVPVPATVLEGGLTGTLRCADVGRAGGEGADARGQGHESTHGE